VELAPGLRRCRKSLRGARSFNPCFCGTRARTGLFHHPRPRRPSFNPCFCGTRARTITNDDQVTFEVMFQSLFLWNSRPDGPLLFEIGYLDVFQSLFLWNSRPDFTEEALTDQGDQFQSLFLWNSRPDLTRYSRRAVGPIVSILVFVELAPGLLGRRG